MLGGDEPSEDLEGSDGVNWSAGGHKFVLPLSRQAGLMTDVSRIMMRYVSPFMKQAWGKHKVATVPCSRYQKACETS